MPAFVGERIDYDGLALHTAMFMKTLSSASGLSVFPRGAQSLVFNFLNQEDASHPCSPLTEILPPEVGAIAQRPGFSAP